MEVRAYYDGSLVEQNSGVQKAHRFCHEAIESFARLIRTAQESVAPRSVVLKFPWCSEIPQLAHLYTPIYTPVA
jgi:hypothetical protein